MVVTGTREITHTLGGKTVYTVRPACASFVNILVYMEMKNGTVQSVVEKRIIKWPVPANTITDRKSATNLLAIASSLLAGKKAK